MNTNGVISFLAQISTYTPKPFPLIGDGGLVAVFWADVDVRFQGSVTYRELVRHNSSATEDTFAQADGIITSALSDHSDFSASWMFIATWARVPFHGARNGAEDRVSRTILNLGAEEQRT